MDLKLQARVLPTNQQLSDMYQSLVRKRHWVISQEEHEAKLRIQNFARETTLKVKLEIDERNSKESEQKDQEHELVMVCLSYKVKKEH